MTRLVSLDSPDDPRIAEFRNIRERDLVGRHNCFIAEGKVVVQAALGQNRFTVTKFLVLENKVSGLGNLIESLPPSCEIYSANGSVFDAIAGFHVHRGILAIVEKPVQPDPERLLGALPLKSTVLLLSGISNHDNMGSIFRNAAAFRTGAILLDSQCCDPLYRKSIRVSVGGVFHVPFAKVENAGSGIDLLERAGYETYALSPSGTADVASVRLPGRTAFLLGSEGQGLAADILERCQTVRIAMSDEFDSLNVAASSAIALHRYWSAQYR